MPFPFDSSAARALLSVYTQELAHIFQNHRIEEWLNHSALSRMDLETIIDYVGWKTTSIAPDDIILDQGLHLGGAGDPRGPLAGIPIDLVEIYPIS